MEVIYKECYVYDSYDNGEVRGNGGPCPDCPSGWQQVKTGWQHLGQMLGDMFNFGLSDNVGVVITGSGMEQYSLKLAGLRKTIGHLDLSKPENLLRILELRSSQSLMDAGFNFVFTYERDPLNRYFAYGVKEYWESGAYPGFYRSMYSTDFVFKYSKGEDGYTMTPIPISSLSPKN